MPKTLHSSLAFYNIPESKDNIIIMSVQARLRQNLSKLNGHTSNFKLKKFCLYTLQDSGNYGGLFERHFECSSSTGEVTI